MCAQTFVSLFWELQRWVCLCVQQYAPSCSKRGQLTHYDGQHKLLFAYMHLHIASPIAPQLNTRSPEPSLFSHPEIRPDCRMSIEVCLCTACTPWPRFHAAPSPPKGVCALDAYTRMCCFVKTQNISWRHTA